MGSQKSIQAGKAKIDVNVDFTHKLCAALMFPAFRRSGDPFSQIKGVFASSTPICLEVARSLMFHGIRTPRFKYLDSLQKAKT